MYTRDVQFTRDHNYNHKSKKSGHRNTPSFSSSLLDEICRSIDHPKTPHTPPPPPFSLVHEWIENDKNVFHRRENAVFLFSSTSTSSDSSDADLYTNRPKPVRTRGRDREKDGYLFDDYEEHERNRGARDDIIKSKSRAMKIYANLRKMKQPISPGAKLTSFFNSIFAGLNRKKSRNVDRNAPNPSPSPEEKMCDAIDRDPVFSNLARAGIADNRNVMMSRKQRIAGNGRPPLPPNPFQNGRKCNLNKFRNERDDEDDGDAISESSSDLFELDHLSVFGINDRFCEELPLYETTYFHKNHPLFS